MLQSIRDHSKGVLALGLMFLLFLSFAIWGIDFQFGGTPAAVEVDGDPLPIDQISRAYQRQLTSYQQAYPGGIPDLVLEELKRNVLNMSAQEEVVYRHAKKLGFRVSDQTLADYLASQPQLQVGGQFSIDQFRLEAQRQGYTPEGFEELIRRALVTEQLRKAVQGTAFMTQAERTRRGGLEQEQRTLSYFQIPASTYMEDVVPDESAIVAEYEANKDRYVTAEAIKLQYIELSPEEMGADIDVDESLLRELYDAGVAAGQFSKEETRRSSHILIAVDDETEDAAAKAQAQAILERVNAGEDFAKLAEEFSADPGSKTKGGDLGFAPKAAFVGPFSDALFAMNIGEVRGPVKTTFGYHIIKLDDIRADETRPYDEVRTELREEEVLSQAIARVDELSQELDEAVYDNDDTLEPAADITGLPLRETNWITRGGGSGIATDAAVREAAFSDSVFLDRRNSEAIRYRDGYVYIRIADHRPARQRTLEETRGEITRALARRFASEKAQRVGQEAQDKLAQGAAMADVAQELSAELTEAAQVPRRGGSLPPALTKAAFAAPAPTAGNATIGGTTLANGDYAVFAVESVATGDALEAALASQYAAASGSYEYRAYVDGLVEKVDVVIRPNVLQ